MLHGIVVLSLNEVIKYTVVAKTLFVQLSYIVWLQIKVCDFVNYFVAGWFGSWFI